MSEINGNETVKILGAKISRKLIPWMIGFVVFMTFIAYVFFGGSSYDGKAVQKQKHVEKIATAEKQAEAGTEEGAKTFITKEKAELDRKHAEEKAAKDKADKDALAKLMPDASGAKPGSGPSQYPLPGSGGKVDPVEFDQLKKAKEDSIRKENGGESGASPLRAGGSEFYEEYGNGQGMSQFVPGSGMANGQMQQPSAQPSLQDQIDQQVANDLPPEPTRKQQKQRKDSSSVSAVDPEGQKKRDAIINATTSPVYPTRIENRYVLTEGATIPCVLEGEINSELPGRINCRVVYDIYDSIYGTSLLISKGSRIMGTYGGSVKAGQERLMIAFSRIILANGRSINIPMEGADSMGRGGVEGQVDNRFWKMFGPSFLIAAISQATSPTTTTTNNTTGVTQQSPYIGAAGQVLNDVSKKILTRYEAMGPIIRIDMGTRLNVVVTKDMAIPPEGNVAWDASGMIKPSQRR